jgi:hypothetical protein
LPSPSSAAAVGGRVCDRQAQPDLLIATYYSVLTAELSDRVATDRWHIAEASAQCRGEKADKAGESVMYKMVKRRISRVYQFVKVM